MEDAIASPQPASEAATARRGARQEAGLLAALVGGAFVIGALVQPWLPPGPVPLVASSLASCAIVLGAGFVRRGRLFSTLAGFRLATVTLIALALGSAAGTLILQGKPMGLYAEKYPAIFPLIAGLRLDDLFHTVWFGNLVGLMMAGLVASAWLRLPVTRRNVGFFAVHLGILVTLAGASLSSVFAVRGRVDLRVGGGAEDRVRVTKGGRPTGEVVPLGATVQLDQFDVDRHREQLRLGVYLPDPKKNNEPHLKVSFDPTPGVRNRLPEGASFEVKAFFPDLVITERAEAAERGVPALRVALDGKESWLIAGERERLESADGNTLVLFGVERPSAQLKVPLHRISAGGGEPQAIRIGETLKLADGTELKALRFLPHATFDLATRTARSLSDKPVNPALEVEIGGVRQWLFANLPPHGDAKLAYRFAPEGGATATTVVAIGAKDRSVLVRRADGTEETRELADGLEVAGLRVASFLASARIVEEPSTASAEPRNPAVLVAVTEGGQVNEALLAASRRSAVGFGSKRGMLAFETRGDEVKAFRSSVKLTRGAAQSTAIVSVNNPLEVGPWLLYQVNYNPDDPTYSGLEAVRDPGVSWVFAGFGLMFFGVVYMMYIAPRLRRREA